MTHTPEQLKKLAEFAAEYCDLTPGYMAELKVWDFPRDNHGPTGPIGEIIYDKDLVYEVFKEEETAPILMHLAQEKLKKEGFEMKHHSHKYGHSYLFLLPKSNQIDEWDWSDDISEGDNENKFIAFWEAVMQAEGGK